MDNAICNKCGKGCEDACVALRLLLKIYNEKRAEEKTELIKKLRPLLELIDWEPSEELRELGEKIINKIPELSFIRDFGIKIGYVLSYEAKRNKGKAVYADCRKVNGPYRAFLPYDIVVTFYEPNIATLSANQQKVLMWHELKHIDIGVRGITVRPHDTEDWNSILNLFGLGWHEYGREIPDILAGEKDGGSENKTKQRAKGTKVNKNKAHKKGTGVT